MMKMIVVVLLMLAGRRSLAFEEIAEERLFPPLHPNCTQSLTDLLLLRQEAQLNRMAAAQEATTELLKATLEALVQARDSLTAGEHTPATVKCVSPFTQVGGSCLLLALHELHTWASARQYCAEYGADLAHFSDVNAYVAILDYVNTINQQRKSVSVWVGGTDEAVEDTWVWITGELMPRGPPFWGTKDGYRPQPSDGRSQNCAILWQPDQYYTHDVSCTYKAVPLCQI
ncbi:ladderlectin-like [Penaeus chinensis]|uniref:ladderlectin-like n=1 Tax=Penaeus chinensis TaxID=139456 RepID=UPI001FB6689C|nr:ladderlectin-like [Penaeus chinensis]